MESAHEWFLFTSCDASKNERRSAENEWVFDASQLVNKDRSSIFHGMMFFFRTYWVFFHISIQRLEANDCDIHRSSNRRHERTSQCKSHYVWNKYHFGCWIPFLSSIDNFIGEKNGYLRWRICCTGSTSTQRRKIYMCEIENVHF